MAKTETSRQILNAALVAGSGLLLYYLTFSAFSRSSRKVIKHRSHGQCEDCGKEVQDKEGIAAHIDHNPNNPNYNLPINGLYRCRICEAKTHLQHAFDPASLGMRAKNTTRSAWGWYVNLTDTERLELPESLTPTIDRLRQMYQKDN